MDRVKQQIVDRPQRSIASKKDNSNKSRGMVVIPYVEGVSEKIKRIYFKHGIHTAMKPINTLKSILVHPRTKKTFLIIAMWSMTSPMVDVTNRT